MLSQETIKKLAEYLRIKPEDLQTAISSDTEQAIDIPELTVFIKDELEKRDSNLKTKNYNEGKTAGAEMIIKSMKEENGIDIEGKEPKQFVEALKKKFIEEAKIEPDKKVQELTQMNENFKATIAKLEREKTESEANFKKMSLQSNILNGITKDYLLSKNDLFLLMQNSGYTFEEENGKIIAKKHGETLRDAKMQDPLNFDVVFDEFATEKGLVKQEQNPLPGGRGGASSKTLPAAFATLAEFKKSWEEQGKSTNSHEFATKAQEYAKNNPDFFKE